jgi:outer membrane receptor protein involved in Fe transport
MNVDARNRRASPYYDWTMRWAKNINNKIGVKFAWQLLKANDWMADDYRNVQRTSVLSKLIAGDRSTDTNYDGINVYGDETSAKIDFRTTALGAQSQFRAGIAAASGGLIPDIVALLNQIIPNNATFAQINTILAAALPSALIPTVNQLLPFYWGLRNNWYLDNQFISRTGYNERDLVDYNTLNFKFTAGLHYKITPGIEASWNTYWGTGTTVYTGADRYSLRNFKMAQHKLEVRHKNWFVRGYTTQENAGEAYQATALGRLMQEAFSPSQTVWYPTYVQNYYTNRWTSFAAFNSSSDANGHAFARSVADAGMPLPGSAAFNSSKTKIRTTPIGKGGAKFLDNSDLWAGEGQLNLSDVLGFSETVEMITGVQWKHWVMNSQGTIFSDSASPIKLSETGGYVQLKKKLFDDLLTLTGALRYDKQTNFEGRFTPRVTAVFRVAKDNNIRLSYQTAYRFPTNQDQYIDLNTGSVQLIGALPEFISYYGLNTPAGVGYTAESVTAARTAGNTALLQTSAFSEVRPEDVSSYELGYKGLLNKKLLIDAYVYYSRYKDFFARIAVVQSATGTAAGVLNPLTSRNYSYIQNSSDVVKALGWGIGVEYLLPRNFVVSGNIFSDQLRDLQPGLISFFNAPKYRLNISLRNDNVYKNIGFNVIVKWQDNNFYEGTFVTGTLPSFTWVDAQISYRMPKTKSLIRIGGTNIGNNYFRTGFGSPYVGGLYYISYGYNMF